MKILKLIIVFTIMLIFVFVNSVSVTYACSCAQPGSPSEELNKSSAVFSGKVVKIVDNNKNVIFKSSADPLEIHFQVIETWKGISVSDVVVKTSRDSASCGYTFALNEEYLIYTNGEEGYYQVNLCSRTAPLANASTDLNELGQGAPPTEKVQVDEDNQMNNHFLNITLISILLFIIILIGFYIFKSNKN
ncbi:hypothetical protein [Ureibacillus manganicus]|uniref:hypothetical protein n=1 Tax=Ureibacillus manganicus TaxID=1266064 RepID=UPI000689545B|nr:hypothetical protein [Ureibacillus manganicus]